MHSSVHGHLSGFYFGATMTDAAMNIHIWFCEVVCFHFSWLNYWVIC